MSQKLQFFVLDTFPKGVFGGFRTEVRQEPGFTVGEAPRCSTCGKYIGNLSWLPPYRVSLEVNGPQFGDFAFFNGSGWILVSNKFMNIYLSNGLKGLSGFEPVEVLGVKSCSSLEDSMPRYFKADVVRSSTEIDLLASEFEWDEAPSCTLCNLGEVKRWKRIVIDPTTMTDEDIFIARGLPGTYIATNRFKQVCDDNDITNAVFLPALSYGYDFYPWESSPMNLTN